MMLLKQATSMTHGFTGCWWKIPMVASLSMTRRHHRPDNALGAHRRDQEPSPCCHTQWRQSWHLQVYDHHSPLPLIVVSSILTNGIKVDLLFEGLAIKKTEFKTPPNEGVLWVWREKKGMFWHWLWCCSSHEMDERFWKTRRGELFKRKNEKSFKLKLIEMTRHVLSKFFQFS